jgi:hypothetical protein
MKASSLPILVLCVAACSQPPAMQSNSSDAGSDGMNGGADTCTWCLDQEIPSPTPTAIMTTTWGSSATDLWVAGRNDDGTSRPSNVFHWDGKGWQGSGVPTFQVDALWGIDDSRLWATGEGGTVAGWQGAGQWKQLSTATQTDTELGGDYHDVWGTAVDNLWAVASGNLGVLAHWDGGKWTAAVGLPTNHFFSALWGSGANDVWAIGEIVVHYDGSWHPVDIGAPPNVLLQGVCGVPGGDVYIVGAQASLFRLHAGSWSKVDTGAATSWDFSQCYAKGDDVWVVGDDRDKGGIVMHGHTQTWTDEAHVSNATPRLGTARLLSLGHAGDALWIFTQEGKVYRLKQ